MELGLETERSLSYRGQVRSYEIKNPSHQAGGLG